MGILTDVLKSCIERGERTAIIDRDRATSYAELADRSLRLASLLRSTGVVAGDRVAFLAPTSSKWHEFVLATAWIGAVPLTLNWRLTGSELAGVINHARPTALLGDSEMLGTIDASSLLAPPTRLPPDEYEPLLAAQTPAVEPVSLPSSATALQIYTSGTSGRPKGVMLSDEGLSTFLTQNIPLFDLDERSRGLCSLPLFHVGGAIFALLNLTAGSTSVIPTGSSAEDTAASISQHGISHFPMVPTMLLTLVEHAETHDHDLSSVRRIVYGGATITPALLRRTLEAIGPVLLHTYGLTETTGCVTILQPEEHDPAIPGRLNSCGRVVPWVELRVADVDGEKELAVGEVGEVQVRSQVVMSGYFDDPELTAEAMTSDGFLRTGDLGTLDADGFLAIVGRAKDLIITGGENVTPSEVEAALTAHPSIAQAVAIGLPDERWGELVTAVVVLRADHSIDFDDLTTFLRDRLAPYKCPKRIEIVTELPLGTTGKIDRVELKRRVTATRSDRTR
ncbi:class I adenylate-forming enzyme family protein [Ilumatobacter nonamiensis]|uniref:class I adenylate-forming enzyme family protein n=1 Tax=Ilumatobacter nonamiensis TaxID=467093 RepID=UPI00034C8A5C|nr:AMP-binding protein [Ilumatobacter nonamiensis]